jgi:DDE family transposase
MTSIAQLAQVLQSVLTDSANLAARSTGFIQRQRAFDGAQFVQALVLTYLEKPTATTEDFVDTLTSLGGTISVQGFAERFSDTAVACLEQVFQAALQQLVLASPRAVPLFERFSALFIQDSTVIRLPDALASVWQGCGGNREHLNAAVKGLLRLELREGQLAGPLLLDGRASDRSACLLPRPPAYSLSLADLGFWDLHDFAAAAHAQRFWLSRCPPTLQVFDASAQRWSLADLLAEQHTEQCELEVELGVRQRLKARLLAQRVPAKLAEQRRRRLRAEAKRKGRPLSQSSLALAEWSVVVTNVPAELLTLVEALALYRIRWQIELVFKLWKSEGYLDHTRAERVARVQCEVYAKLLALLCEHWLMVVSSWNELPSSPTRQVRCIHKHADTLVLAIAQAGDRLETALAALVEQLKAVRGMHKRKSRPNAYDALLQIAPEA